MFSDVAKYWKQYKTTKLIKVKRIASIWCQNDKNNSKLHTRSNYYQFASIWRQNNQKHWGTVAKHSKQRKTTKLIKLQWIDSIGCQNDQNNSKLQTRSNYDQFASIWRQNDKKSSVTSQNIQNNAKLHNWSNYWIASIWCQNDKNNSKLQTRSNYDQFASIWRQNDQKHWGTVAKHSKQRRTTKVIKL